MGHPILVGCLSRIIYNSQILGLLNSFYFDNSFYLYHFKLNCLCICGSHDNVNYIFSFDMCTVSSQWSDLIHIFSFDMCTVPS